MRDIKRAIFAESEVKTKKKFPLRKSTYFSGFADSFFIITLWFMHISPFMDVYKKKPSNPKEFSGDPTLGRSS